MVGGQRHSWQRLGCQHARVHVLKYERQPEEIDTCLCAANATKACKGAEKIKQAHRMPSDPLHQSGRQAGTHLAPSDG